MAHFKRRRPKQQRSGCLSCKPHKGNGQGKQIHIRGIKGHVSLKDLEVE